MRSLFTGLALVFSLSLTSPLLAQDSAPAAHDHAGHDHAAHDHGAAAPAAGEAAKVVPYVLNTCVVSGGELGSMGEPVVLVHEGREVKFCCEGCVPKFKEDPAKHLAKTDEQLAASQRTLYPLETCVVTGEKLGSMGEPKELMHANRLVRFCCEGCEPQFKKDPTAALAKLDQAVIDQQVGSYPLKKCVVSGDELGAMGEPEDVVIAGKLVRLCCTGCKDELSKNPGKYLAMVNAAWKGTVTMPADATKPGAAKPATAKPEAAKPADDHAGHQH